MSKVYFTSDLHLGHENMAKFRKYPSVEAHDEAILDTLRPLTKNDILYVLGDAVYSHHMLQEMETLRCRKILVAGNHDDFNAIHYLSHGFENVCGALKYKNYWLTHIPIHGHEMRDRLGNIHGHVHIFSDTPKITDPRYFNVNWERTMHPVPFDMIEHVMGRAA